MGRKRSSWWVVAMLLLLISVSLPQAGRAGFYRPAASARPMADTQVSGQDIRISSMGPDGDTRFFALRPAVAYNSDAREYLVVWAGDTDESSVDNELEIFGQRVDASGALLGETFRISDMGPDGDPAFDATDPDVAYSYVTGEYLVVWRGDDDVDNELEIYAQRVDASGVEVGINDMRISTMGPDGDPNFGAYRPAVVFNPVNYEYLVVWHGDDIYDNATEIYGQRLSALSGAEVGADDFAISDVGSDPDDADFHAQNVAVTLNLPRNEYLVTWEGNDDVVQVMVRDTEIFGQRLDALGNQVGDDDFRISSMGPDGNPHYTAGHASVTYNPIMQEYLVVWTGDDGVTLSDDELEVYGQRLSAGGVLTGTEGFRISSMGPDGDPAFKAFDASVQYNPALDAYLVIWRGDDNRDFGGGALVDEAYEIFGQWLDGSGNEIGDDDVRISDAGDGDADPAFAADRPALAFGLDDGKAFVVWQGDDDGLGLVDGEVEIAGRRFDDIGPAVTGTPAITHTHIPYARHVYTLNLSNPDTLPDTITITAIATDTSELAACGTPRLCEWQVILPQTEIPLDPGEQVPLTVTVLIPANEVQGVTHGLSLIVTSQREGKSRRLALITSTGGQWNRANSQWAQCRFDIETVNSLGFILMPDMVQLYSYVGSNLLKFDYNHDGSISIPDMILMQPHLGESCQP